MTPGHPNYLIPRKPLLLLAVAMIFTVPAMFGNLAGWVPAGFIGTLLLRFFMEWKGTRLRSLGLKMLFMAAGAGAVALSYGSLVGPEPGLSICLVFIAVKILESHTARDFHVLAALGWFASLAQVIISQSLTLSACSIIAFFIVLTAVLLFHHRSTSPWAFLSALRETGILMLQAVPLVLVLFFLFPRGSGSLGFFLHGAFSGRSGISDTLSPGSISSLTLSNQVAFRAVFPDGGMPAPLGMYWRGGVLTTANGMTWTAAESEMREHQPEPVGGKPIHQRILLQPHGGRWIFALDKPAQVPRKMMMGGGNVLLAKEAVHSTLQYDVLSLPLNKPEEISSYQRRLCLQLNSLSPAIQALVQSWSQNSAPPSVIVEKALEFFQKGRFRYTLTPGEYGANALDEFLFRRRAGFCEHYAAAFATLMRAAGIPARIVIGYQGGEYNTLGRYLIVRQSYAHAWCEVWMSETGWKRIDPTSVVTPSRVNAGFDSLDSAAGAGADFNPLARALRRRGFLHNLLLTWDAISYEWDTRVAGFDSDAQQSLFIAHGLTNNGPIALIGWLMMFGAALLAFQWCTSWWRSRPKRDPIVILYERFCRRAQELGAKRDPWEGPMQFAQRATQVIPSQASRIRRIADLYTTLRYSAMPSGPAKVELAREINLFCRQRP